MKIKIIIIPLILIISMLALSGCSDNSGMFLDGFAIIDIYGGGKGQINACEKEIHSFLRDFENKISVNIPSSEVARFNGAAINEKIYLSEHVYKVFKLSSEIYEDTEGAFNFCLYDLSLLWGFYADEIKGRVPLQSEIDTLMQYSSPEYIEINDGEKSVFKTVSGVTVDFGGIAKGYALGVCREIAQMHGITGGTISIAGNVYGIGQYNSRGGNVEKIIAITDPRAYENENPFFCKLLINDCSVSVSGDYERFFTADGVRYCHVINPSTGSPVQNGIISVIIADKNAAIADAYSTAVMVSGLYDGIDLMNKKDLNGIIITKDKNYYVIGNLSVTEVSEYYEQKSVQ